VRLTRDAPRDKRPFLRFFESPVEFAAATACVVFDAAILDSPVRDRNPDHTFILAPLLEHAAANARADFVSSVRVIMHSRIGAGRFPAQASAAPSDRARELTRRLEAHGVTYSGLADEAKCEAAQSLLTKDKTIAEVTKMLGFAEPSAFTRAFKTCSGATPARWRASRQPGR
jgi:Helix-turn-helix domain